MIGEKDKKHKILDKVKSCRYNKSFLKNWKNNIKKENQTKKNFIKKTNLKE